MAPNRQSGPIWPQGVLVNHAAAPTHLGFTLAVVTAVAAAAAVPSLFRTVNQAVLAGGASDSKGVITTVGSPISALGADGSVVGTDAFPGGAPTPVTASPGLDPARYNAP